MSNSKIQTGLVMLGREKGAFGLDYSLHTSFLQMEADCTWGEGLVDDIAKSFGHLNCIFCLSSSDKMDSMAFVGWGKLLWTTTSGLLKLRTLFGAKSGDGRGMDMDIRCNRVSRMASIKPSEDSVLLSKREGSHDDGG